LIGVRREEEIFGGRDIWRKKKRSFVSAQGVGEEWIYMELIKVGRGPLNVTGRARKYLEAGHPP
jgi:hypothetical protein